MAFIQERDAGRIWPKPPAIGLRWRALTEALRERRRQRRARASALRELSPHLLRDIGLEAPDQMPTLPLRF